MIKSMTGFGRCTVEADNRVITIEVKSVNHRYLETSFRMPRIIGFIEESMRSCIQGRISRGHADIYVSYKNFRSDSKIVNIDKTLLGAYLNAAREAAVEFGLRDDLALSSSLRLPDVTSITEGEEDTEAVTKLAVSAFNGALDGLIEMRMREGERLYSDFIACIERIEAIHAEIEKREPQVVVEYRNKLKERLDNLLGDVKISEDRLAVEVAVFADRASIHEEIVRIVSHIREIRELLTSDGPVGRKLDFLVQELNREFNTIGSKANDSTISANVIDAKAEIEKLREQIQNIE